MLKRHICLTQLILLFTSSFFSSMANKERINDIKNEVTSQPCRRYNPPDLLTYSRSNFSIELFCSTFRREQILKEYRKRPVETLQ